MFEDKGLIWLINAKMDKRLIKKGLLHLKTQNPWNFQWYSHVSNNK